MTKRLVYNIMAVMYLRVSSKEQEREGFSIPAQQKLLKTYARHKGYLVVQEFIDVETAKKSGRSGFNRMVQFLRKEDRGGKSACRVILVEKTDRLYRNFKDMVTLDDLDVEIHFVKEGEILSKDSGSSTKFMHDIKVALARNYINNLSEDTKKGMLEKARQGYYPSYAPLGYMNVDCNGKRIIQPDPFTASIIQRLFESYASGQYSLQEITEKAFDEGLVTRKTGSKISKSVIHQLLKNPIYFGDFDWAGKRYDGNHEPIVSRELFDRVQEVMAKKSGNRKRQQKHDWAFRGMVRCGHCGCLLTAERQKGKYTYYHCTGRKGKCPEKYVREEELDRQFRDVLKAIRIDGDVAEWAVRALKESHADKKRYHEEVIDGLQKQLEKLRKRLDGLYEDKLDGSIDEEFFDRKFREWTEEQNRIQRQIEKHNSANLSYFDQGAKLFELSQNVLNLYDRQEMKEKRKLLQFVCSNSTWKDGQLTPNYRKPFDMIAVTNTAYQQEKATNPKKSDLSAIWLPGPSRR